MKDCSHRVKMLKANALVFIVVIVLMATSLAVATSHVNRGSTTEGRYSPSQSSSHNYTLTIKEKGLPAGYLWNVNLSYYNSSGIVVYELNNSATSTIQFSLANGNYYFTPTSSGYASNVSLKYLSVSGSNLTCYVSFTKAYNLTFIEKGLPLETNWTIIFLQNGTYSYTTSSSDRIVIMAENGTHQAIAKSNGYYAYLGNSGYSYANIYINGAPLTQNVTFFKQYDINFTETGLPAVNTWNVSIANSTMSSEGVAFEYSVSNSSNYILPEINGTWFYSFNTPMTGYHAYPSSGSVNISGKNVSVNVEFSTSTPPGYYYVNFTELGLASGTSWSVTLNGTTESSTTSTISFTERDGTYSYSIGSVSGYTASPSSGSVTVSGASKQVAISFTAITVSHAPPIWAFDGAYLNLSMTMTNSSGTFSGYFYLEILTVNNTSQMIHVKEIMKHGSNLSTSYVNSSWNNFFPFGFNASDLAEMNSGALGPLTVNTSVQFSTPMGTFTTDEIASNSSGNAYKFYIDNHAGILVGALFTNSTSSVKIKLTSTNIPTTVKATSYPVTFTETGLPSGTTWYVNLTNGMKSGAITGSSYSFSLANGSYTYTISTGDKKYSPSPSSGSLTVNGASVSRAVKFSEVEYTVTFKESGLPSGTRWYVSLEDNSKSSTTNAITFSVPNGTYSFGVDSSLNMSGYAPSSSSGYVIVNGANKIENISFSVPSTHPPVWAFKGAYANYTMNQTTKNSILHGYIYFRIISVNDATQMVEIFTKAYNGTKTTTSYYNTSWNEVFFAYNQTVLSMLNNGTLPASFHGSKIKKDVTISTPMGTFTTDEINTTLNSSSAGYEVIYVDAKTGLLVSVSFSNSSGKVTAGIASSNILNANHNPSGSFTLSSTELYGAIGGVVAVVAVVSAISIIRKRR